MTAIMNQVLGGDSMYIPDMTILLIVCYVFGILTAAVLYLMIVSPVERRKYNKGYQCGFLDGIKYAERAEDDDY